MLSRRAWAMSPVVRRKKKKERSCHVLFHSCSPVVMQWLLFLVGALARYEVDMPYISLLKKLYANQQATVLIDKDSDAFKIELGDTIGRSPKLLSV